MAYKFTRGPWVANESGFVFAESVPYSPVVVSCGDPTDGEITNGIGCCVSDQRGEKMGNAHLIAAAPELLAAVDGLLYALMTPDRGGTLVNMPGAQERAQALRDRLTALIGGDAVLDGGEF